MNQSYKRSMTTVVLEDEEDIRKWLVEKIDMAPELEIVGEAANIDDAFDLICHMNPEVAFMDVKLLGGDAFTLLNRLQKSQIKVPYIVMATGFPEYGMTALNDYREYIVQYLLKPFVSDWDSKLRKAIDALVSATEKEKRLEDLIIPAEKGTADFLFIKTKTEYLKIEFRLLYYIEAGGGGSSLIVYDDRLIELNITLTKFLEKLPQHIFIRVSKTNIININHVVKIVRDERTVYVSTSDDPKSLGIGDAYYSGLKKRLNLI